MVTNLVKGTSTEGCPASDVAMRRDLVQRPKVSVVICTLNEEQNLACVLPDIPTWVEEVILVDGHSTDRTIEVAKTLRPDIKVLVQPGRGKGAALKLGIQNAIGDIVVTLDADGATPPIHISKFVAPLLNGYDFAKGSRFLEGTAKIPFHRKIGNHVLVATSNVLFGTHYTDICSGYNAFWKQSFLKVPLTKDGFEMEQQFNVRVKKAGLKVTEVGYRDGGRHSGQSKTQDVKQGFHDWFVIIAERFVR